jgi:ribonucleoside-diphosphate reductase alpha chain
MKKYGRRNGAILTQAPTGSVSQISRVGESRHYGVSSGVEPVFRNSYKRRKKINVNEEQHATVSFVDALGDKWEEYTVYHANVNYYLDIFGSEGVGTGGELPDYFVTSDEINWEKRVELQGVEQDKIDHSISSTINLPRGTSTEVVAQVYLDAWKKGLKGVTVYVDGCRDGVLIAHDGDGVDDDGRPVDIIPAHAPKRPEDLPCEVHSAQVNGRKWTILIGLLEDQPYEVFVGHSEDLSLPSKCKFGLIRKIRRGRYDLHVDIGGEEDLVIGNITKTFANPESAWATRLISIALRHGTPIDFLVEQLQKDGNISDINRVIARLLKKFIKDGQKVRSSHHCPACHSNNLVYEEGCMRCLDCGNAKCG